MNKILAMILAGGRVDELDVLTLYRPKSAVPFGGMYRIIDFPLSNLMHSNIEKVGILLQYHSASLINHIRNGASWDMTGRHRGAFILPPYKAASSSTWYKGTADAIFQNLDFIDEFNPEFVLILSGDHIYKMDYTPLIQYHHSKNADLTIVFTPVDLNSAHRFGLAEIDNEDNEVGGRIKNYQEKPSHPNSNWASLTIYLFKTEVLKKVVIELDQQSNSFEFGRDIIPKMIDRFRVFGYKFYGYWGYTRTLSEFWQANMDLLNENPKIELNHWQIRTNLDHRQIRDRLPSLISNGAQIENSIVPAGCCVKGSVINSILFPGVSIEQGAIVKDSIIMFDSQVAENAFLNRSILDTDVQIGKNVKICTELKQQHNSNDFTVIGQYTHIPPETKIGHGCILFPKLKAENFQRKTIPAGEIVK